MQILVLMVVPKAELNAVLTILIRPVTVVWISKLQLQQTIGNIL
jgi:hypothetical protein